jgi:hypothetical protein
MHMLMRLVELLRLLTIVALASPLAVFADLNSGLVALYTFDGNGINSAGPGLNLNGHDVTYGSGLFGQAASFNGQSSYFESADNVPITGNQSRTIDVWLNANSFTGRGNLVAWGPWQQAGDSFGTYLLDPSVGQAWATFYWRDHSSGPAPFTYAFGEWINLAIVYDGLVDAVSFYLNGNDVGSFISWGDTGTLVNTVSTPMKVGYNSPGVPPGSDPWYTPWNGLMDNLRIYNRALTPAEVQALATVPEPSALSILALAPVIGMLLRGRKLAITGRRCALLESA